MQHETITSERGVSHAWQADGFAYVWLEGTAFLAVGEPHRLTAHGDFGWSFYGPDDIQRVYVPGWSEGGAAIDTPFESTELVEGIIGELVDHGMTERAYLFMLYGAPIYGPVDHQAMLRQLPGDAVIVAAMPVEPPMASVPEIDVDAACSLLVDEVESFLRGEG